MSDNQLYTNEIIDLFPNNISQKVYKSQKQNVIDNLSILKFGSTPITLNKASIMIEQDYTFIEGIDIINYDLKVFNNDDICVKYLVKGEFNSIGNFKFPNIGSSLNKVYIQYNNTLLPFKKRVRGSIPINILPKPSSSTDLKDSNMCIKVFNRTENFRYIGEYEIKDNKCTVNNLDKNCQYDLIMFDRNNIYESTTLSRRTPI